MTAWSDMSAVEFDPTLVRGKKARRVVETAPETLFPRLLPEPDPVPARLAEQLPGQDEIDLFGGEL